MLDYLIFDDGDIRLYIIHLLLCLPIIILALSVHETAHGYVASKLGDPTAKNLGRLTLNPLKHLDPIGFLCMLLFGIGWATPVPINTRYFKKPRRDMALSAGAGPLSNILLAVVFAALMKVFYVVSPYIPVTTEFGATMLYVVYAFLYYAILLNVNFAVFNLLPVPPFDGSRLFYVFLPPKYYFGVMKYERYISIAIMLLLFFGVLTPVISFVSGGIMDLIFFAFGLA